MDAEKAFIAYWDDATMPESGETQARDIAEAAFMAGRRSTAAPELLAALESLLTRADSLDQSATHDGLQNIAAIVGARAAIAKAKGE
jgi:hypothetical protein